MNSLQILSFVGFTLLVAVITWWKVRKTDTGSQQGYFLAGRSLKAPVIAASLMLTNLSTEQLVGLSGQAYKSGMSVMGWEVTSAVTLIFLENKIYNENGGSCQRHGRRNRDRE